MASGPDFIDAALADALSGYATRNPESRERHEHAERVLPGGSTRSSIFNRPHPLTLERGGDGVVEDADGHEYIDLLNDYTAALYGHKNPLILAAIRKALEAGLSLGGGSRLEQEFAARLVAKFPSVDLLRFTNSGTEANLMALATARAVTGRDLIVAFDGGYHGGVLSFAGKPGSCNAPFQVQILPYDDCDAFADFIAKSGDDVAAIIAEPMQGAGGCLPADPEFLRLLRDKASGSGALLIFDEVMTSRLWVGGLQTKHGVFPDLTTMGKFIGGGGSFGAFGGARHIMQNFDMRRPDSLLHSGTFNNDVVTMSAGLAGMTHLYTEDSVSKLNGLGDTFRDSLNRAARDLGVGCHYTGMGSMLTAHPSARPPSSAADVRDADDRLRELYFLKLVEAGIWASRRGMMSLSLDNTRSQIDTAVSKISQILATLRPFLPERD